MSSGSSMYLALGYRCNHHCYFCPCGKDKGTPAAETAGIYEALEHGIIQNGVRYVTLSGGEPTIHPDFSNILRRCIQLGAEVTVLTNGDRLHDREFALRCFEGVDPRHVSVISAIHSLESQLHDRVTGVSGSFERTLLGLKNVRSLQIPVTVKQCVSAWNYSSLPEFVDFIFREYGPYASMTICGMDFCGMSLEETASVAVGYKEMGPYIERMLDLVEELRNKYNAFPRFSVCDLPLCAVDPYYWRFYTKSSRRTLEQYSAPSAGDSKIGSTYHVTNDCDTYFQACSNCATNDWCPGVWQTAFKYFGESEACAIQLASE